VIRAIWCFLFSQVRRLSTTPEESILFSMWTRVQWFYLTIQWTFDWRSNKEQGKWRRRTISFAFTSTFLASGCRLSHLVIWQTWLPWEILRWHSCVPSLQVECNKHEEWSGGRVQFVVKRKSIRTVYYHSTSSIKDCSLKLRLWWYHWYGKWKTIGNCYLVRSYSTVRTCRNSTRPASNGSPRNSLRCLK